MLPPPVAPRHAGPRIPRYRSATLAIAHSSSLPLVAAAPSLPPVCLLGPYRTCGPRRTSSGLSMSHRSPRGPSGIPLGGHYWALSGHMRPSRATFSASPAQCPHIYQRSPKVSSQGHLWLCVAMCGLPPFVPRAYTSTHGPRGRRGDPFGPLYTPARLPSRFAPHGPLWPSRTTRPDVLTSTRYSQRRLSAHLLTRCVPFGDTQSTPPIGASFVSTGRASHSVGPSDLLRPYGPHGASRLKGKGSGCHNGTRACRNDAKSTLRRSGTLRTYRAQSPENGLTGAIGGERVKCCESRG